MVKVQVIKVWISFFSKLAYILFESFMNKSETKTEVYENISTVSLSNGKSNYHGESCFYLRGKSVP